jgi:hypothetical protein
LVEHCRIDVAQHGASVVLGHDDPRGHGQRVVGSQPAGFRLQVATAVRGAAVFVGGVVTHGRPLDPVEHEHVTTVLDVLEGVGQVGSDGLPIEDVGDVGGLLG